MTLIRWILSLAVLAVWCALVGTWLYVALYEAPEEQRSAQAIVVLGGGPGDQTDERLQTGLALYEADVAPILVLTGAGTPATAVTMAEVARAAGVPDEALLIEPNSYSTLQDALFTADFEALDKDKPIIIVTQRYHLPRAWASFRWAGFKDVIRVAADPNDRFQFSTPLLWESVKWPLNAIRAGAASAAMAGGVPRENFLKYLE